MLLFLLTSIFAHQPQRRWRKQQSDQGSETKHTAVKPDQLVPETFPPVCEGGLGPVGNGGLSLRSRKWMIRAIETCPLVAYSGLEVEGKPFACKVYEKVNEDFYFGTVLRAIGAPLPTAYTASLFATEMLWPEQAWDLYGVPEDLKRDLRGGVVTGKPFVWIDDAKFTTPGGVHKPWWYHPNSLTRSTQMAGACPFLPYIFTEKESRWEEATAELTPWVGVGH